VPNTIQTGKTREVVIKTKPESDLSGVEVQPLTGSNVYVIEQKLAENKKSLLVTVQVDADADIGPTQLKLIKGNEMAMVGLSITAFKPRPIEREPTPDNITEVDAMWSVLPDEVVRDNFGRRTSDHFYAIEVAIGNNSGFDLQIVSVGFTLDSSRGLYQVPTSDHRLVRGTIEKEQAYGKRALALNLINGVGTLASGFLPFFRAVGPRANFGAASSIFNGQFKEGFALAAPDLTVRQLNRLENQVMHEDITIQNNSQVRTVVFLSKGLVGLTDDERKNLKRDLRPVMSKLGNLILVGRRFEVFRNREMVITNNANQPRGDVFGGSGRGGSTTQTGTTSTTIPAPTINTIVPDSGLSTGGIQVQITGTGFVNGATVSFDGVPAPITSITGTSITAITPAHVAGAVNIVVTNRNNLSGALANGFTYIAPLTLIGITPNIGAISGGQTVTITGRGILSGAAVSFDGTPATSVNVSGDGTSVTAVTPAHAAGPVSVTVTNPDGRSFRLTGGFTYTQ